MSVVQKGFKVIVVFSARCFLAALYKATVLKRITMNFINMRTLKFIAQPTIHYHQSNV